MQFVTNQKTTSQQIRLSISRENYDWLVMMEQYGVDRSSLVNLALSVFMPRTETLNLCNDRIKEVALTETSVDF